MKLLQFWSLFVINFARITVPSSLALILEKIFVRLHLQKN